MMLLYEYKHELSGVMAQILRSRSISGSKEICHEMILPICKIDSGKPTALVPEKGAQRFHNNLTGDT